MQTNDIIERSQAQLPDTLEDLTQFVLVGKAKLNAYMIKLQTVNKLSTAQEIRDQTLKEAQEVSTALIAAEQRIGELLLAIPKAQGKRSDIETSSIDIEEVKTKTETIKDMGYSKDEASDYQQMAKNPEVVQRVIEDALANGDVVTKSQVLKEIKASKDEAKRLQAENKELEDYIQELEKREPEVKIVEKKVEVMPKDYEEAKRKAELADGYHKDFNDMRTRYEDMATKWKQAEKEKERLVSEMKRPENEQAENIKRSALFFCAGVSNFIEKYGGYVWLTEHISEMNESERNGYLRAVNAVESWVSAIKSNMEGMI